MGLVWGAPTIRPVGRVSLPALGANLFATMTPEAVLTRRQAFLFLASRIRKLTTAVPARME